MPGRVVDRGGLTPRAGLYEIPPRERVRVARRPPREAAVGEDGAELGQFEDGDVDPAAIEQRGGAEERQWRDG